MFVTTYTLYSQPTVITFLLSNNSISSVYWIISEFTDSMFWHSAAKHNTDYFAYFHSIESYGIIMGGKFLLQLEDIYLTLENNQNYGGCTP